MFKITNAQLIEIAAVDAGLDPFAEYCTKGVYAAAGYKVRAGEKPVLTLELWCPRVSKDSASEELLSSEQAQENGEKSGSSVSGMFFAFKTCHLFCRSQVQDAEELALEKEAKKLAKAQEKQFKRAVMAQGGIAPSQDYESLPAWCKRKNGLAIDVAVDEIAQQGYPVQNADELYVLLAM